jgi:DNA-binding NtrC family response regulator
MEAAVLNCRGSAILPGDLPPRIMQPAAPAAAAPARYSFYGTPEEERHRIEGELRLWHGNLTRTARALGMSRNTLRTRMADLDIAAPGTVRRSG